MERTRRRGLLCLLRQLRESVAFGADRIRLNHEERILQPLRIAPTVIEFVQGEVLAPKARSWRLSG